jgi:CRP/FNR family cyclic AMP-dependent transcriptional regulator
MRRVLYILGLLSDDDIDWICSHAKRITVPTDATLIAEGDRLDATYLVAEGEFVVRMESKSREIARLGPGEILGEISLVDSLPATASVVAAEASIVLRLSRRELEARLHSNLGFRARFYHAVAVFLAHRYRQVLVGFGYSSAGAVSELDGTSGDELDLDALDRVSLAADRYQWILDRLVKN